MQPLQKLVCAGRTLQCHDHLLSCFNCLCGKTYNVHISSSIVQFEDAWLEIRSCEGKTQRELEHETVLRIAALKEVMQVAENTMTDMQRKGGGNLWDYSRKLENAEIDEVMALFEGVTVKDGAKSVTYSTNVVYGGRAYTLTLFGYKSQ